jgi:hypothetical protein
MEQEYTTSLGYKIFYSLLGAGMIIFAFFLGDIRSPNQPEALLLIPLILLTGSVLIFINIVRRKVVIYNDSILVVNLFTNKEVDFKDIKGCRIGSKLIVIEPVSAEYPTIRIGNYIDFSNSSQLTATIKEKFKDLDAEDYANEHKQFLQDASLGFTEADREAKLKKAKAIALGYMIGGWVVFFLALFFNVRFFEMIAMAYPVIGILIMLSSKGLIKFITNFKTSIYPSIIFGYMPAAIFVLVMGLEEYNAFQSKNLWLPAIVLTVIIFAAIYFIDRIKIVEKLKGKLIFILLMSVMYSFALVWNVNCFFDNSLPKIYKVAVLDHRIEHGKSTSYYLTISPWGPEPNETEVDVGSRLYYNTPVGDTVIVKLRSGMLNIPWYKVAKN